MSELDDSQTVADIAVVCIRDNMILNRNVKDDQGIVVDELILKAVQGYQRVKDRYPSYTKKRVRELIAQWCEESGKVWVNDQGIVVYPMWMVAQCG